ncbi:hypothetical protein PC128_g10434 [Phytophthora cactorum]|nr:hypothetical protein PC128_g10434 [Phytophthora cactorum]
MRSSFVLALLVVVLVAWDSIAAEPNVVVQTNTDIKLANSVSTLRYLKGSLATTTAADSRHEERLLSGALQKIPGFSKIKAAFQKNPSFAKNLETFRLKRQRLDEFFKENPVIKKEIIVATVLLTLIFSVPIVVNAFYPA